MREILTDLVRQTKDLFEIVKITGTEDETKIQAVDKDKTLFVRASLNTPQPDLEGEFGISNLALLDGLLSFPSYKTDDAKFAVKREIKSGNETVTAFIFKDANGKGATYKTMAANLVNEQAEIAKIPWTVSVVPSKSKIAEFSQLSRLYSEVDKSFRIFTDDGDLVFGIGDDGTSTHNASMVFESGITGELSGDLTFDIFHFLSLMKIAGSNQTTMNITSKGVLGVTVNAPTGIYDYFLRAKR
jgi:hypothetical protein